VMERCFLVDSDAVVGNFQYRIPSIPTVSLLPWNEDRHSELLRDRCRISSCPTKDKFNGSTVFLCRFAFRVIKLSSIAEYFVTAVDSTPHRYG